MMICPYCDSVLKEIPDAGNCPRCGGSLAECIRRKKQTDKTLIFPDPPVGVYKDVGGHLEIEEDRVTFYRHRWPFTKRSSRTILFREIYAVSYIPPTKIVCGAVCVREWQDRHVPLPTNDFSVDKTSVYFTNRDREKFRQIYLFLQECADIASAQSVRRERGDTVLLGKYKGSFGYMELGDEGITIYKKAPLCMPTEKVIPYDELAEVAFRKARGRNDGSLSVRARSDCKILTEAMQYALSDDTSVDFSKQANDKMCRVYAFLLDRIHENTSRWSIK